VLYEVANESPGGGSVDPKFASQLGLGDTTRWGDTTAWQYWVINYIKNYEEQKRYQKHPVGMTMQFPVADQRKVNDPLFNSPADWISPGSDEPAAADLGIVNGINPPDASSGTPSYESLEPARYAMGDTLRFAQNVHLVDMEPRGDLSSTAYALAKPGTEYLVLEPSETGSPFTVTLEAGTYSVEWYNVNTRETVYADKLTIGSERSLSFRPRWLARRRWF